jgi:hypothetical protein
MVVVKIYCERSQFEQAAGSRQQAAGGRQVFTLLYLLVKLAQSDKGGRHLFTACCLLKLPPFLV